MMPYLDKYTRNEVLERIKGVSIRDNRFKSTTFSSDFAEQWLSGCSNPNSQAKIINKINLEPGIEGRFIGPELSDSICSGPNGQFEFLINNTEKEITVTDVEYDQRKNIFRIKSDLKVV